MEDSGVAQKERAWCAIWGEVENKAIHTSGRRGWSTDGKAGKILTTHFLTLSFASSWLRA